MELSKTTKTHRVPEYIQVCRHYTHPGRSPSVIRLVGQPVRQQPPLQSVGQQPARQPDSSQLASQQSVSQSVRLSISQTVSQSVSQSVSQ